MKYRIESISQFDEWKFLVEHTDDRYSAMRMSQWAGMFLPHYGLVINVETGAIEYEFGANNRDWIKWALEQFFETLPTQEELK